MKAREQGSFGLTGMNGLYYLRARYYDPAIGRFLTRDPLPGSALAPQSLNPYPYVGNNPVNRVDPSGMLSETADVFGCGVGLLAAGVFIALVGFWTMGTGAQLAWAALVAAELHGLEAAASFGVMISGGGFLTTVGLGAIYEACTGSDILHEAWSS